MVGFILTGHGQFAPGLASAIAMVAGDQPAFTVVPFEGDQAASYGEDLRAAITAMREECDGVLVFTDLLGGSINNSAVSVLMRHRNVFVVAGINLTLLLEFLLCEEATTEAAIIYATSAARESIVFINPLITQPSSDPQGESHD